MNSLIDVPSESLATQENPVNFRVVPTEGTTTCPPAPKTLIHSFSKLVAEKHGYKAAILLEYLGYKLFRSKHTIDNRNWYYATLDDLASQYPYLARSTIADILSKLTKNEVLLKGNHNKKGYDRTTWYAFNDRRLMLMYGLHCIRFDAYEAKDHGIVAAVLLHNIRYWLTTNRLTNPGYKWHRVSASEMTRHLPFTKSLIVRSLKHLVSAGVLIRRKCVGADQAYQYALADRSDSHGTPADLLVSESDMHVADSDNPGAKSDNNTHCEDPWEEAIEKDTHIERPTSSPSVCLCFSNSLGGGGLVSETTPDSDMLREARNIKNEDDGDMVKATKAVSVPLFPGWKSPQAQPSVTWSALSNADKSRAERLRRLYEVSPGVNWEEELAKEEAAQRKKAEEQAREKAQLDAHKARCEKYASPDEAKESVTILSAREKADILKNAILSINRIGMTDKSNRVKHNLVSYSATSFKAAQCFFAANPDWSVVELTTILHMCLERILWDGPLEEGEYSKDFHLKKGTDLSFLLIHLEQIVTQLEYLEELPDTTVFLSKEELFGKPKAKK